MLVGILLSSCSTEDKTKPVISDITGAVVQGDEQVEEGNETAGNETVGNETITGESGEEINVTGKDINETEGVHIIIIKDLKLDPQELTIKVEDTVVWKHEDEWEEDEETKHYLAAHSNEFRSPIFFYGQTFEHTFDNTGTFTYIDVMYKGRKLMRGTIIVE